MTADIRGLADKHYHVVASSLSATKTKGVAVVARRNFKITEGRLTIVKTETCNRKIAFISAYAPNSFDRAFYDNLTNSMLELNDYSFTMGGDFNVVWSVANDRTGKSETKDQKLASLALQAWANSLGLTDLWRFTNPSVSNYSFFSARHKSSSRIDYIIASPKLFQNIHNVSLLSMAVSDHKGVLCSAVLNGPSLLHIKMAPQHNSVETGDTVCRKT